jgi:serine/threonine protein kinase
MVNMEERQYRPGERVPGTEYVVVRLEAEGGHGALYLVKHHFLEKKIQMLKTLRRFEPSAELVDRLKREAQMLAAMDHPHIVSVTSGGLTDEKNPRPYFVMERLKGRSLAQVLPEAPEGVGIDAALKVTIEVCDALEYVHVRHGVVHRDIKPDNVFLQVTPRNGSVTKLLDFGVAHIMDLEKRYTKNNLFLGTPRYASPEQIMGDKPSPQTDLYAVGLLLYELLLGYGPFDDANNFAAIATAHVQREPPGFPKTRRFPDGLEELVMSLLRKQAADRPKSAEWLASRLRQIKRIAELAEHSQGQDLNRTEGSPMQNVLTGHRAHLTEAGVPPDVASERALGVTVNRPVSRPGGQPVSNAQTTPMANGPMSNAPTAAAEGQTSVESPLGYRSTVRIVSPALSDGAASVDRASPTRTLQVALPTPQHSDTQEMPDARSWLPPGDPNPVAPSTQANVPVTEGMLSTSSEMELTRDAPRTVAQRQRQAATVIAVVLGVMFVIVAVFVYASRSSKPGAASADVSATPSAAASALPSPQASSAPPPLPSVVAAAPQASAAPAPQPTHVDAPNAPPPPPPPDRVAATPAAKPTPSPAARAPSPPAKGAMHLPPSGL